MHPEALLERAFGTIADVIHAHALREPQRTALLQDERRLDYGALDALMDRIAAALQRTGLRPCDAIALCAGTSIEYAAVFLGALRAGVTVAPLAPSATAEALAGMIADSGARLLFLDAAVAAALEPIGGRIYAARVALDGSAAGIALEAWLAPPGSVPAPVAIQPEWPFNIIYSSGTTGTPKGIVQPHRMRWGHVQRGRVSGYEAGAVTLLATPLYSNTTLVSFFPTLALGGSAVLMAKFDAARYLALAERHRVTHTMLVPVQYQRIMALPEFGRFDLSSFRAKFCTSAPFSAALKADILRRWPGGLTEVYGMTEGGGSCILAAHQQPDKLHTVGRPAPGHDIRLIDDAGRELGPGEAGEVVGRSPLMMTGYHNQPEKTAQAEWLDAEGRRFIRTGDVGRFDAEGFLVLLDRKKDMIISGGFNVFPSDLEAVLRAHPAVADAAVVGVPSERWGETPVAFVEPREGVAASTEELLAWANARLGKTQRLAALQLIDHLPRSAIGKVLKRELRERYAPGA
ncbi:MAG: class I adenylate-forming enzyme family protein [Betaproteobacteria bacterium]|nr:class I adenylate-forming enzyme family protein [Betaproteobacteria bacterium]